MNNNFEGISFIVFPCLQIYAELQMFPFLIEQGPGFYTKGRPLIKSNSICPSDKLSWQRWTWLSSYKYQYTRKFLYQPRKWLFGQPARKLSVDREWSLSEQVFKIINKSNI